MNKSELIGIAKARFAAFVKKVYGEKTEPNEESLELLERYIAKPRFSENRFKLFLSACDVTEMRALQRNEKATDINPKQEQELRTLFELCRNNAYLAALF